MPAFDTSQHDVAVDAQSVLCGMLQGADPKLQGRALASFVCKLYRAISGDGISTKLAANALEEASLNTPHLQLALDVVNFVDVLEDSACGSFAGVSFKFSWRGRVAVVAALDADWEDTVQWFL